MRTVPEAPRFPLWEDPRIEGFLERLDAPLAGIVSDEERGRLREETRFHLESLIDAIGPEAAFRTFGSPEESARLFLESWCRAGARGPIDRRLGPGAVRALATFGLLQLAATALVTWRTLVPAAATSGYLIDPARFHDVVPRTIPAPESTPSYLLLAGLALFGPIVAGYAVGRSVPLRPSRVAIEAVAACTIHSFLAGLLFVPSRDHVALGIVQIVWWIPAAALAAHFGRAFRRSA